MKGLSLLHSKSTLGGYLRDKRLEAGLTQAELSRFLGYSAQFIANWERGASSPPAKAIRDIIRILRIPEQEMLEILYNESVRYWKEVIRGNPSRKPRKLRTKSSKSK